MKRFEFNWGNYYWDNRFINVYILPTLSYDRDSQLADLDEDSYVAHGLCISWLCWYVEIVLNTKV